MALALNNYETVVQTVDTNSDNNKVYTAPVGYDSIVLLAQAANVSNVQTNTVTLILETVKTGSSVRTEVIQNFPIGPNDSVSLLQGKLVLQTGDSLIVKAGNDDNQVKFIASVLETLNQ
tara:strand:+ start:1285 stop:1641 length:357 start_codon:yes stop_codon:yes gene_type:complete